MSDSNQSSSEPGQNVPTIGHTVTPLLTAVLKPSAEVVGREIASVVQESLQNWRRRKQDANLEGHFQRIKELEERKHLDLEADPSVKKSEIFERWVEGAKNIEPDRRGFSEMWQCLFIRIAMGDPESPILLKALSDLEPAEAMFLFRIHRNVARWREIPLPRLEDLLILFPAFHDERFRQIRTDKIRHFTKALVAKGLIKRNIPQILRMIIFPAALLGALILFTIKLIPLLLDQVGKVEQGIVPNSVTVAIFSIFAIGVLLYTSYLVFVVIERRIHYSWVLTWIGAQLVEMAPVPTREEVLEKEMEKEEQRRNAGENMD